jgi:ribosome-associated translation inhibitor RaiA
MDREQILKELSRADKFFNKADVFNHLIGYLRTMARQMDMTKALADAVKARLTEIESWSGERRELEVALTDLDRLFPHLDLQMKAINSAIVDLVAFHDEERIIAASIS